jgi:2',3'-cyclic-nucleotide 2'-phosphodiesterase (5'-nucleotidase family)
VGAELVHGVEAAAARLRDLAPALAARVDIRNPRRVARALEIVRTEETNLGNVSADANKWMARRYDPTVTVSIKNGGGIRSAVGFVNAVGDVVSRLLKQFAGEGLVVIERRHVVVADAARLSRLALGV